MHVRPGEEEGSSRVAGGRQAKQSVKVVVDMREFRSTLPSLLYDRGIELEPRTLQVWGRGFFFLVGWFVCLFVCLFFVCLFVLFILF